MRLSGGSRPISAFIMRDRKGLLVVCPGHEPSLRPPITSMSTLCSRASSVPKTKTRGWRMARGFTASLAVSAPKMSIHCGPSASIFPSAARISPSWLASVSPASSNQRAERSARSSAHTASRTRPVRAAQSESASLSVSTRPSAIRTRTETSGSTARAMRSARSRAPSIASGSSDRRHCGGWRSTACSASLCSTS